MRIYQLGKELGVDNRRIIDEAERIGCKVTSPSQTIPEDIARLLRERYPTTLGHIGGWSPINDVMEAMGFKRLGVPHPLAETNQERAGQLSGKIDNEKVQSFFDSLAARGLEGKVSSDGTKIEIRNKAGRHLASRLLTDFEETRKRND